MDDKDKKDRLGLRKAMCEDELSYKKYEGSLRRDITDSEWDKFLMDRYGIVLSKKIYP